jgi:hypothetical protein
MKVKRKSAFSKAVEIKEQARRELTKRGFTTETVFHSEGFMMIADEINSSEGEELEYWELVMKKFNGLFED